MTFLSSSLVSKICICKYAGDKTSVAFKIDVHQIWSILLHLFSFLPILEQETPLREDEGRTETKAEGNARLVGGCWGAWSFWLGPMTSRNSQLWGCSRILSPAVLGGQDSGPAWQGPCPEGLPLVSEMAFSGFRKWFLVECQVAWWFRHLRCTQEIRIVSLAYVAKMQGVYGDMSFLKGFVGHWRKSLTHQLYKCTRWDEQTSFLLYIFFLVLARLIIKRYPLDQ